MTFTVKFQWKAPDLNEVVETPLLVQFNFTITVQGYPEAPFGDMAWVNHYAGNIMIL